MKIRLLDRRNKIIDEQDKNQVGTDKDYSNFYPNNKDSPGIERAVLKTMAKLPNVVVH